MLLDVWADDPTPSTAIARVGPPMRVAPLPFIAMKNRTCRRPGIGPAEIEEMLPRFGDVTGAVDEPSASHQLGAGAGIALPMRFDKKPLFSDGTSLIATR